MADYTPVHSGGAIPKTYTVSADVTGGRLVAITGNNTVGPAAAGSLVVVGVAAHDQSATAANPKVTVWPLKNVTHQITSTGTIAAGDGVIAGALGVAATGAIAASAAAGTLLGKAETGATGGAEVRFLGY
jgi:predicted RecA/RadA family phage recombinase